MKKILSIDGGGIRGIIPGQVLIALEKKLQVRTGKPDCRIADYFDFFAGTSTGGILTCICLCPSETDPRKARFSAEEAVDLYVKNGDKIFDVPFWRNIATGNGNLDEKYPAAPLENQLKEYFKDLQLSQLLKPCIIPAYDIKQRKSHFFTQHDAKKKSGADFYVRDVCRATSAAPTYFETSKVYSMSGVSYPLIDGGVFANNPALCAYSEVRNAKGDPSAKDMFILSLGTGSANKEYEYEDAKNWGAVGWIRPIIDIMMAGASETTNYHLTKMFSVTDSLSNYSRMQPASFYNAVPDMDNAEEENIRALVEVGIKTTEDCDDELNRIVEILIQGDDPVEFE